MRRVSPLAGSAVFGLTSEIDYAFDGGEVSTWADQHLLLPTSGHVQIFGEDVLRHRYRVLPRMNFSSPYVDLPHRLTVRQNLVIYARLYGLPRREERIADTRGPRHV